MRIQTEDDDAAIAALRERFGVEATVAEGAVTFYVAVGRGVRPAAVRRARRRRSARSASRGRARRRLHVLHRHDDPRRRGAGADDAQPHDDADDDGGAADEHRSPRSSASACPQRSWRSELRAIKIVWRRELIRFRKRPPADRHLARAAAAVPVRARRRACSSSSRPSTHGVDLKTFIFPGILCMSVMFTAMFSAASIVWDREFGFLREMMVAPVRRSSIVIGKCLGGATVASLQGVILICARRARRTCPTARR